MMAREMASVAPIVMTTALVLWKEAMVPTMYERLRVTTACCHENHKINTSLKQLLFLHNLSDIQAFTKEDNQVHMFFFSL